MKINFKISLEMFLVECIYLNKRFFSFVETASQKLLKKKSQRDLFDTFTYVLHQHLNLI